MDQLQELTLKAICSKKTIALNVPLVKELIRAYLLVIPNEKRELSVAVACVRLSEKLLELVSLETAAAEDIREKRINRDIIKGLKND